MDSEDRRAGGVVGLQGVPGRRSGRLNAEGIVHLCVGKLLEDKEGERLRAYIIRTPMQLNKEDGSLYFPAAACTTGNRSA